MRFKRLLGYAGVLGLTLSIVIGGAVTVQAVTSTSPNYQVTETQFGATSKSCSGQYCAQASIGEATDAKPSGNSTAGFQDIVDNEPSLEVIIDPGESNLGVLSTERTATKTTSIKVQSYLISGGYTIQIIGEAPKFQGHTLNTSATPANSVAGVEQFGINVVANTSPGIGANPVQVPDGQQIFGKPDDNYKIPNKFMFQNEDIVARGVTDSGRTDYTVSMVVNIASSTPAGKYTGDFTAMVVPVY